MWCYYVVYSRLAGVGISPYGCRLRGVSCVPGAGLVIGVASIRNETRLAGLRHRRLSLASHPSGGCK